MLSDLDLIEQIESTPDTVIQLVNGQKMIVLESADEIVRRVVEYRRRLLREEPVVVAAQAEKDPA